MRTSYHGIAMNMNIANRRFIPREVCVETKQSLSNKSATIRATKALADEVKAIPCIDQEVHSWARYGKVDELAPHMWTT